MENRRILNWSAWSILRKAQVIGAISGLLLSLGIQSFFVGTAPHELFDSFSILWFIVSAVPLAIMRAVGIGTIHTGKFGYSWITFTLVALINSLLFFVAGSVIGWLLKSRNSRRK